MFGYDGDFRLRKLRANPKHPIHRTWSFLANFPKKHYDSFTPRATAVICPRIREDGGANQGTWGNRVPVISFMVCGVGSQVEAVGQSDYGFRSRNMYSDQS